MLFEFNCESQIGKLSAGPVCFVTCYFPPLYKHINKTINFLEGNASAKIKSFRNIYNPVSHLSQPWRFLGSRPLVMWGWNQALLEPQIPHLSDLILLLQNKPPSHWSIAAAFSHRRFVNYLETFHPLILEKHPGFLCVPLCHTQTFGKWK